MKQTSQIFSPTHGGQLRQIAARYGVLTEHLVDFSANINPDGPPTSVLAALHRSLEHPATLAAYPDLELAELKGALAVPAKILPENIAVANGFVPLLEAAICSLSIVRCLLPVPSFSEYRLTLAKTGVAVVPYSLSQERHFSYEPECLLQAALEESCDALLLANPQNPSGVLCAAENMRRLIEMAEEQGINVLLDEAFIDYAPSSSLAQAAVEQDNLLVFHSITKFFAIPGLRVAYAVSNAASIKNVNHRVAPWPITTLAADAVCAALRDDMYAEDARRNNVLRRVWLERELALLNIFTYPSSANFLLLRFAPEVNVSLLWERMIVEEQTVLRSCANFEDLASGHLRIAVRSDAENERLVCGLKRVLARMKK